MSTYEICGCRFRRQAIHQCKEYLILRRGTSSVPHRVDICNIKSFFPPTCHIFYPPATSPSSVAKKSNYVRSEHNSVLFSLEMKRTGGQVCVTSIKLKPQLRVVCAFKQIKRLRRLHQQQHATSPLNQTLFCLKVAIADRYGQGLGSSCQCSVDSQRNGRVTC